MSVSADHEALPLGSLMLHIGPYKSGSTAIQAALAQARDELPSHGVVYPGTARRHAEPGWAVLQWSPRVREIPPISVWEDLLAEVHAALPGHRVVVSSEDFGGISPPKIQRVLADLGRETTYLTAVVRPLDLVLPSQWQEHVKSMRPIPYDDWLRQALTEPGAPPYRAVRASHDVGSVLDRWLQFLPPERMVMVALSRTDRGSLFRGFEGLLGLPDGLLAQQAVDNSSLSPAGTELLRRVNAAYETRGWTPETYRRLIRYGAASGMMGGGRQPSDGEPPRIPSWAVDLVRERCEQRAAAIRERGVRVIGDLDDQLLPEPYDGDDREPPDVISQEAAAAAVTGVIEAALAAQRRQDRRLTRQRAKIRALRGDAKRQGRS